MSIQHAQAYVASLEEDTPIVRESRRTHAKYIGTATFQTTQSYYAKQILDWLLDKRKEPKKPPRLSSLEAEKIADRVADELLR